MIKVDAPWVKIGVMADQDTVIIPGESFEPNGSLRNVQMVQIERSKNKRKS